MSAWDWFWSCGGWVLSGLILICIFLFKRWADKKEAELDELLFTYVHPERWNLARRKRVGTPEIACPRCGAGTNLMCDMSNRHVD